MSESERKIAKEILDWIESSGMPKGAKSLLKKDATMAERAYANAMEREAGMPAKTASARDMVAPEDMPSPPPLKAAAQAAPASPEATAKILGTKAPVDSAPAIEGEVLPPEFDTKVARGFLPENATAKGATGPTIVMGEDGVVEKGLERARSAPSYLNPPNDGKAVGVERQMRINETRPGSGEGVATVRDFREKLMQESKFNKDELDRYEQYFKRVEGNPALKQEDKIAAIRAKREELIRNKVQAGVAIDTKMAERDLAALTRPDRDAYSEGLEAYGGVEVPDLGKMGRKAAKGIAGAAAVGGAAYGLSKMDWSRGQEQPPAATDMPSPLSDKGRQEYAAKAESKAASPYNVSDIMAPTVSTSKVGRAAPEAPDVTEENTALASELDKMKEAMKIVAAEYKLTKDQQAKAQLWEGLVNGMAAIAAGMYGMKHGLDMGGIKFSMTDWQKRADSAREDWMAGRMAAEKDYEMSKSLIEGKKKGKYDNWQVNQKLFENAVGEAERRDRMNAKNADLGMDTKRLNMQAQKMAEDSKMAKAELMIKLKESGGDKAAQKALADRISDFDKTLALYGKNSDDLSLQTLKRLNGEISQLTGAPLVPESSFEGGWIGGPDAADIEASRTPTIAASGASAAAPLTQGGKVRMMDKKGMQHDVPAENVEKAKSLGWQQVQ